MDSQIIISGPNRKMAPLISFNTIFDIDVGLIQLIYDEYLEPKVFNVDTFNKSLKDIIKLLYYRTEKNPLYLFANNNISRDVLDQYYKEFTTKCMDDILSRVVSTEVINMIQLFVSSKEISPSILYYSEKQKEILDGEPILQRIPKISFKELNSSTINSFNQFFFKDIDELKPFIDCKMKTFYISNLWLNLNKERDDFRETEELKKIIGHRNHVNIFTLYNEIILRKDQNT